LPDGTNPRQLIDAWAPWISEAKSLMGPELTFNGWKYAGGLADQPAVDIAIYRIIQGRMIELHNEDLERKT
jgi:hypothetical protein